MTIMTSLSQYLVPEGIFLNQAGTNPTQVIGLLANHLYRQGVVHFIYAEAVTRREAIMPTGLPLRDDVAVAVPPTDPEHVIRFGIAMATLTEPVAFHSMDDPDTPLPVRVVFALALRSKDEQVDMLSATGALLMDTERLENCPARPRPTKLPRS